MRRTALRLLLVGLGASALVGCASSNLVVVLPEKDGHVGAVAVGPGPGETLLNKAYLAARPRPGSAPATFTADPAEVNRIFGPALAALPARPKTFRLYFLNDSTQLTPESQPKFEGVFAEVAARPAPEIVVTGHTDTVGTVEEKDLLSRERARAVSELFVARGIPKSSITIAGRGDREPATPTADQVPEPRNRRVEITVR